MSWTERGHAIRDGNRESSQGIKQRGHRAQTVWRQRGLWGGENSGSCKEDDLCLSGVEDEATGRAQGHNAVVGVLYLVKEDCWILAAAEDRAVVGERNTKGGAVINKLDSLIKSKGPEGCRTDPPWGNPMPMVRDVL